MNTSINDPRPFLPGDAAASRAELMRQRSAGFVALARHMILHGDGAHQITDRLPIDVQRATKAAVMAGSLGDGESRSALAALSAAWLATLAQASVFDKMLANMRQVPILTRFGVSTVEFDVTEVGEGDAAPVGMLTIGDTSPLSPRKVSAISVVSSELARLSAVLDLLDSELRSGLVKALDSAFLSDLVSATTPIASAGTAADAITDVDALLTAVPLGAASQPFFIFSQAAAKKLTTKNASGIFIWPMMTPTGGTIAGVKTLVTDALPAGAAVLVDASQLAAAGGEVTLSTSGHADLQLLDFESLDQSPEASDVMTSLWQNNLRAVKATRTFCYRILRNSAVASLSGVSY